MLPNLKQKGMHGGPGCCRGHHRSPKKLTPGHASRKSFFFFLCRSYTACRLLAFTAITCSMTFLLLQSAAEKWQTRWENESYLYEVTNGTRLSRDGVETAIDSANRDNLCAFVMCLLPARRPRHPLLGIAAVLGERRSTGELWWGGHELPFRRSVWFMRSESKEASSPSYRGNAAVEALEATRLE